MPPDRRDAWLAFLMAAVVVGLMLWWVLVGRQLSP